MPDAYDTALASGSTSLCRCFRLTRRDGTVLGFTDHDNALSFDGSTFEASAALSASETASRLGLAPDDLDATGALSAAAITESDLAAGAYDGATVEAWDVDWSNPGVRRLLGVYTLGQVERDRASFRTELRSLSARLEPKQGRVLSKLCDVRNLGDARCKLALGAWQHAATVVSVSEYAVTVTDTATALGFFERGTADWTSGANAGTGSDIRASEPRDGFTVIHLWHVPARALAPGDTVTLTAGCDRTAATCAGRFGNLDNFRGFPFLPGDNFTGDYGIPGRGDQDGGSRYE
ncbi:DUF2163 domain-containing protein [Poseidonocella sp. HB161398]|uniref:DUF2163 domain-containing protein n=1 Tax=Poseidonocella sp. HB161398 TaxID=2320855 RepID=UPI0014865BFA|nr:DUF2163 domain-containing protein [Poseidonocella sp. HB161398]